MSHFSQIKTQIRDLISLQAALTDLNIDWKPGPQAVKGYQGQTHTADIVIEQDNGYGVGFSWNGQQYEMVADLQYWQQPVSVEGFIKQVTQRYAYHTVMRESMQQGFNLAEQEQQQDGSIRLVLQRWNG
jgi:hypothetical protein